MSAPELRAGRRVRPIRNTPEGPGSGFSSIVLIVLLLVVATAAASWAVKQYDENQTLRAENSRLAAEAEQLRLALHRQQQEAASMRNRLLNAPPPYQPPSSQPAPMPRSVPTPAPRIYPRSTPAPRPAPRQSTNAAIKSAESVCGAYGYGTVDERACRRRQWQKMRDECAALRSKEAFIGAQQREAHRRNQAMWCEAERMFKIIH